MVKSSDGVSSVAPFLMKCYEMVDDSSTDSIISWSANGDNSFVISDTNVFSAQLLPKYFKHSNLSSFVHQLNIYGFRKVDADRCEFANDGFVRGRKDLLKNVIRRKKVQSVEHQNKHVSRKQESASDTCKKDDPEKTELWKEVDILKGDKKALAQELVKVRQVQGMEESQQEMLSFLVMVMHNPSLLVQLLQPKEKSWQKAEGGGGGAMILEEVTDEGESNSDKGTAKSSSNDVNDFLSNADMLKFCLDENHVPLIIPDLYDDGAWEKLLLLSPSRKKKNEDEDETMELDKSYTLNLIQEEMERADDLYFGQLTPERSRNLEI
ncbi:hypothetical protein N665_0821s0003 [Sinapis alba]|nr:hypothetical protein N665_0821s0003 [Sinapis alba]